MKKTNAIAKVASKADYIEELVQGRLGVLYGAIPEYAVKTRPGKGGGTFRYIKHGYVKSLLNRAFGFDWDFRLLPVFNGSIFIMNTTKGQRYERGKTVDVVQNNICVYGELTVRLRDQNGNLITTIVRSGAGSQDWLSGIEFGDALKGAESDALKVAASSLGRAFGLQLYWDDETEQGIVNPREGVETKSPATIVQLVASVSALGINLDDVLQACGKEFDTLKADEINAVWKKAQDMLAAETSARFKQVEIEQ